MKINNVITSRPTLQQQKPKKRKKKKSLLSLKCIKENRKVCLE